MNTAEIIDITSIQLQKDAISPRGRIIYLHILTMNLYKQLKFSNDVDEEQPLKILEYAEKALELAKSELDCCDGNLSKYFDCLIELLQLYCSFAIIDSFNHVQNVVCTTCRFHKS